MDEFAIVVDIVSEIVEEEPPQLFDLTGLQKEANSRYGLSAAETLTCAQSLYEDGMLSYPRTSSHNITPDMEQGIPSLLSGEKEATLEVVAHQAEEVMAPEAEILQKEVTLKVVAPPVEKVILIPRAQRTIILTILHQ